MPKKDNHRKAGAGITRRAFARSAALAAATVAVLPDAAFSQQQPAPPPAAPSPAVATPPLSAAGQAEVEGRVAGVLRQFGGRLSDAEKAEVRRLITLGQKSVEDLRAYPLDITNEPATILKLRRGGKR